MGSLNLNSKRRRKFLDILKYVEEGEQVHSASSDIANIINKDNLQTDMLFVDSEFLSTIGSSHKNPFLEKGNESIVEIDTDCDISENDFTKLLTDNGLFDEILSHNLNEDILSTTLLNEIFPEETNVLNDEQNEPIQDDYGDMLEHLIASTSPDELVQKISITNEIPEDFLANNIASCKRKLSNTDFEEEEEEGIKQLETVGALEGKVTDEENCNIINANSSLDNIDKNSDVENTNIKKVVNFENLANKKIFRVLNRNLSSFTEYKYKTPELSFSMKMPDLQKTRHNHNIHFKKAKRAENITNNKKEVFNKFITIKKEEHRLNYINKKRPPYKSTKRGTLGWQFKLDMEQFDEFDDVSLEDTASDDVNERLQGSEAEEDDVDSSRNFRYYKDHVGLNSKHYNNIVLQNIYSNASKMKTKLKYQKPLNKNKNPDFFSGKQTHQTQQTLAAIDMQKLKEPHQKQGALNESSQQNVLHVDPVLNMPVFDC